MLRTRTKKATQSTVEITKRITVKSKVIAKDTTLLFTYKYEVASDGLYVYGETNLPEGTKIFIIAVKGHDAITALNATVKHSKYKVKLNQQSLFADTINIDIYCNKDNQTPDVLAQLKHIKGGNLHGDTYEYTINLKEELENELIKIIGVDVNHKVIGKLDGKLSPVPNGNIMRYKIVLNYKKEPSKENLEKDIRYYVYQAFKKDPSAKAVTVLCFTKASSMAFKTGDFAPNGSWYDASNYTNITDFKLNIHY